MVRTTLAPKLGETFQQRVTRVLPFQAHAVLGGLELQRITLDNNGMNLGPERDAVG
jgi:hypothetical protein